MLRFHALIFLIGLASSAPSDGLTNVHVHVKRSVDHLQNVIGFQTPSISDHGIRAKRQYDYEDAASESQRCLQRCILQLRTATQELREDGVSIGQESMNKPVMNFTQLEISCTAMRPSIQCYDRCPTSSFKSMLDRSMEPLRYICIDRFQDIRNNYRCMKKLEPTSTSRCTAQCRRYESAVNQTAELAKNPFARYSHSRNEIRQMLAGVCQYIGCTTDCAARLTRQVCGETAANLVTSIMQKLFASIQNYADAGNTGDVLPEECRRLGDPDRFNPNTNSDETPTTAPDYDSDEQPYRNPEANERRNQNRVYVREDDA